jgi:hypothetical protein
MGLTKPRAYQIYDLDYKQSVRVVTITNITLSGGAPSSVDGVNLSLNDRILVIGQSTGSQNGIYYVTTVGSGSNGTWARSIDTNETGELDSGTIVMVTEGTIYADTQWKLTTNDPIVIGTTALTFVQNYSANSISAGTSNVSVQSNSNVSVAVAGSNIVVYSAGTENITANIIPTANVTYNLGNATNRFKDIYLSNNSIFLGNVTLSADATSLLVNGSTVVTASGSSTLSLTGNITGGNLLTGGLISATGNITGGNILGGANVNATTHTGTTVSVTGNITGGNVIANGRSLTSLTASNIDTGTLAQARLANSAVTLGSTALTLGATVTTVAGLSSVTSTTFVGSLTGAATTAGTVTTAAQPNITSVGTLSSLAVTGNITSGNVSGTRGVFTNLVGTLETASQPNITAVGTLGSLAVTANVAGGNLTTAGQVSATGNITGGNINTAGVVRATGDVFGKELWSIQSSGDEGGQVNLGIPAANTSLTGQVTIDVYQNRLRFFQGNNAKGAYIDLTATADGVGTNLLGGGGGTPGGANTQIQFNDDGVFGGTAGLTFNKTTNAVATTGTFSATGNITGGNLSGTSISGTLTTAAQTNITSVGTLSSLAVTGNTSSGNFVGTLNGSGANVTAISATNISSGTLAQARLANAAVTLGSTALTLGATVTTVAGLSSVTSTTFVGALTGAATTAGTVTTSAQPNITSVGTLSSLAVTGNTSSGNFVGTLNGSGANVTSINANNISTGTLAQARLANAAVTLGSTALTLGATVTTVAGLSSVTSTTFVGALTGAATSATTAGTVTTAAQPNITSVGTLSSLSVTANVTGGNLVTAGQVVATGNVNGGNLVVTGNLVDTAALEIITGSNGNITLSPNGSGLIVANKDIRNGQANGVGNIGTTTGYFNTIFAKATSAQYADLAEMYVSDADYPPGTVVEFGGDNEITISSLSHSTAVAGIVSTNPSYLMNSTQQGEHVLPIALTGRVPCQVQGPVRKGDVLVASSTPGVAQRIGMNWQPGCVLGKSMEIIESNKIQTIEVAVGRL